MDYKDQVLHKTLRELILDIKVPGTDNKMFHSINPARNDDGHLLTYNPAIESEARSMGAGLIPFLKHIVGPTLALRINGFFTDAAVERTTDAFWDPVSKTVVQDFDEELEMLEAADADLDFSAFVVIDTSAIPEADASAPERPDPKGIGGMLNEADSVTTVGTTGKDEDRYSHHSYPRHNHRQSSRENGLHEVQETESHEFQNCKKCRSQAGCRRKHRRFNRSYDWQQQDNHGCYNEAGSVCSV